MNEQRTTVWLIDMPDDMLDGDAKHLASNLTKFLNTQRDCPEIEALQLGQVVEVTAPEGIDTTDLERIIKSFASEYNSVDANDYKHVREHVRRLANNLAKDYLHTDSY